MVSCLHFIISFYTEVLGSGEYQEMSSHDLKVLINLVGGH